MEPSICHDFHAINFRILLHNTCTVYHEYIQFIIAFATKFSTSYSLRSRRSMKFLTDSYKDSFKFGSDSLIFDTY